MIVSIDRLSSRYGVLPSFALEHATTFDLRVMDLSIRYDNVQQQKRDGTYQEPIPQISEEEMIRMIDKVRNPYDYND